MNIEEAIKNVKKIRQDYNLYYPMDRKEVEAVETLLTAYEKEKEKNKELEKKLDEISEIHFPIIY